MVNYVSEILKLIEIKAIFEAWSFCPAHGMMARPGATCLEKDVIALISCKLSL